MSKLSTLRRITKVLLIGLAVCIVLVASGLWAYQMYYTSLPLLVPTHSELISTSEIASKAMPIEEAMRIRKSIFSESGIRFDKYYYAVPIDIESLGTSQDIQPIDRDVIIYNVRSSRGIGSIRLRNTEIKSSMPGVPDYSLERNISIIKLKDTRERLLDWVTPIRSSESESGVEAYYQVARSDLKNIPFWIRYIVESEVSRNGTILEYSKKIPETTADNRTIYNVVRVKYDPSLHELPIPSDLPVREVEPEENEFYSVYFNCPQVCTAEEIKDIYEEYEFSAIESFDEGVGGVNFYDNSVVATESQLQKAMQDNRITWYQRYDRSHWRQHYPEEDDMDKSFPIQITTYLPDVMSEADKAQERQRIEDLVRAYGGRTFEEAKELGLRNGSFRYNKSEESKLLVDKDANSKLKYKRDGAEPFESFLFRKNIHDYIVADFPADKVWELMQDQNILRVNKADVTQNRAGHPESGLL